ncbi:MAG: hypothetical protein AB1768_19160 [Pseudomonadota bacterium]
MKPLFVSILVAGLATFYFSTPAQAGTRDPAVNHRQHHQQQRIAQGVRSGELTRGEVRHLAREQRAIRAEERAYKADGHLTARERADLHRDLNRSSRHIYNEKHDAEKRN